MPELFGKNPEDRDQAETQEVPPEEVQTFYGQQEKELSPEILEKIMGKIQDIGEYGTAYTAFGAGPYGDKTKEFTSLLKDGILGTRWIEKDKEIPSTPTHQPTKAEQWVVSAQEKDAVVHFNIVGRGLHEQNWNKGGKSEYPPEQEIMHSDYGNRGVMILFKMEGFIEDPPKFNGIKNVPPAKHFMPSFPGNYVKEIKPAEAKDDFYDWLKYNSRGEVMSKSEYGFILSSRIPPRRFLGLIAKDDTEEIIKTMLQTYKDKEELLLPIHNFMGGLEWPRKMTYEEVKKFVEERDKKKEV